MEIILEELQPSATLADFADKHGLTMRIKQYGKAYSAQFDHVLRKEDGLLLPVVGSGCTPDEAMANYACLISVQFLVVNWGLPGRKDIYCPRLTHRFLK